MAHELHGTACAASYLRKSSTQFIVSTAEPLMRLSHMLCLIGPSGRLLAVSGLALES